MKLPVLFVAHGSPLNAVRDNTYTEEWQNYGDELLDEFDGEIRAVLCVSSQWVTEGSRVTAAASSTWPVSAGWSRTMAMST